jgi:hypothetical protein
MRDNFLSGARWDVRITTVLSPLKSLRIVLCLLAATFLPLGRDLLVLKTKVTKQLYRGGKTTYGIVQNSSIILIIDFEIYTYSIIVTECILYYMSMSMSMKTCICIGCSTVVTTMIVRVGDLDGGVHIIRLRSGTWTV